MADTSGTPGYMAPEVMCRLNHKVTVDYFAVGVMAYECMYGRVSQFKKMLGLMVRYALQRPYIGKSRKEIRDHIL